MKTLVLSSLMAMVVALNASAEIANRIDGNKLADVNGKNANLPTLNQPTVNQPTVHEPSVNEPNANLPQRTQRYGNYATPTRNFNALPESTVPATVVPQKNFSAKRAVLEKDTIATPIMSNITAPVSRRVIRPFTPSGENELVQQLRKLR